MTGLYGTFADSLYQVIFERSHIILLPIIILANVAAQEQGDLFPLNPLFIGNKGEADKMSLV